MLLLRLTDSLCDPPLKCCLSSEKCSSVNLLSQHNVLWGKPCCRSPRLFSITTVRWRIANTWLVHPFLNQTFAVFPSLLQTLFSFRALLKPSPVHSLTMPWLVAKGVQRPLHGIKAHWHLQRIPAIHQFHLLQITKGVFVVREQASV